MIKSKLRAIKKQIISLIKWQLQSLFELELAGCNEVTEAGLWACLTPRIVSLSLADCINIADEAVGAVAQLLPSLYEFSLQASSPKGEGEGREKRNMNSYLIEFVAFVVANRLTMSQMLPSDIFHQSKVTVWAYYAYSHAGNWPIMALLISVSRYVK